jgi:hypothetical protein
MPLFFSWLFFSRLESVTDLNHEYAEALMLEAHQFCLVGLKRFAQMGLVACGNEESCEWLECVEEAYKPKAGELPGWYRVLHPEREANGHHEEGKAGKEDQGALHALNITVATEVQE